MPDIMDQPLNDALIFISNVSLKTRKMQLRDIQNGVISNEIHYINNNDIVKSPYAGFGNIFFPRSFLYLLWATCYYLFRITEKAMDLEMNGQFNGSLGNSIDIQETNNLFNWALSLRSNYSIWPKNLPNPNRGDIYCNDTNKIFSCAFAYIYFHEYSHIKNREKHSKVHWFQKSKEWRADRFARKNILQGCTTDNMKRDFGIGIASAGLSLFYSIINGKSILQSDHPDLDIRLYSSLKTLKLKNKEHNYYLKRLVTNGLSTFCSMHNIQIPNIVFETVDDLYKTQLKLLVEYKYI